MLNLNFWHYHFCGANVASYPRWQTRSLFVPKLVNWFSRALRLTRGVDVSIAFD